MPLSKYICILFFAFVLLSCHKPNSDTPTASLPIEFIDGNNCDSIHLRNDFSTSFYESNFPYQNISNNSFHLDFSNFSEEGVDSVIFLAGESSLENNSTLLSFILMRNNRVIYENYLHGGYLEQSNNIHSASKTIISSLIGIAIHQGVISSNESVLTYFPDYTPEDSSKNLMTIQHLLNMTSGLAWEEDDTEYQLENDSNWTSSILNLPLAINPGISFNYSTGNTHLLSAVLQNATHSDNCQYLYNHLMSPLGITVEHWGIDPQGYASGGYNFYITPREMARYGLLYLNEGNYQNQQIIPSEWITQSLTTQIDLGDNYGFSNCWWTTTILGHEVFKAWGYGGQYICLIPDLAILIVSTANTNGVYDEFDLDSFVADYVIPAVE